MVIYSVQIQKSFTFTSHHCSVNNNEHAQRSLLAQLLCPVVLSFRRISIILCLLFMKIISLDPQVTPSLQTAKINNHQVPISGRRQVCSSTQTYQTLVCLVMMFPSSLYSNSSGTRAYGRDFTIAVEMQTYTSPNNTHNIVV